MPAPRCIPFALLGGWYVYRWSRRPATGPESTVEVPADVLGVGRVTIRATGRAGFGIANTVNAEPVTIEVVPAD